MRSRLSEGLMNDLKVLGGCIIKTNTVLETMLLRLEQEVAKPEKKSLRDYLEAENKSSNLKKKAISLRQSRENK